MHRYEWTDANDAMKAACLSLARMVHLYETEETANTFALSVIKEIDHKDNDSAWLTDALMQLSIDFDNIREFKL